MKSEPPLSLRDLNRATLARQMLLKREGVSATAVVERLVGMQAQWPAPPYPGLWTRLKKFARADLVDLITSTKLVRATMMRGTLHVVLAEDYLKFRPLLQPMLTRSLMSVSNGRREGIDFDVVADQGREFLKTGPRTFEEIREYLSLRHPRADTRIMGHAVRMLVPLVQVPGPGAWGFPQSPAFALGEAWLGKKLDPSNVCELIKRYLAAFGPATPGDFQVWSGLLGAKAFFEQLRAELVVLKDIDGREQFDLPDAPRPGGKVAAPVRFLPEFDNALLSHVDRSRVLPEVHKKKAFVAGLRVLPTILVDGFVSGAWKVERTKKAGEFVVEPYEKWTKAQRDAVMEEGERLSEFMGVGGQIRLLKSP